MLDHLQTLELIKTAQSGGDDLSTLNALKAKEILIEANMPLVKSVAKRFKGRIEYDDLLQLGALGLIKAINNFDPDFNVRFSTYAVPMICGEIKRFLRDDGIVKVSRSIKAQTVKISEFIENFKFENQRDPSSQEIADALDMDAHDVVFAMDSTKLVMSLYEQSDDDGPCIIDHINADNDNGEECLDRITLKECIRNLPEREQKIIILRFFRDKTQSEVAETLGVSQVQVSRIECKIIRKLRESLSA